MGFPWDFHHFVEIFHGTVLTELGGHTQGLGIDGPRQLHPQHPQPLVPLGAAEGTQGAGGDQERRAWGVSMGFRSGKIGASDGLKMVESWENLNGNHGLIG